MSGCSNTVRLQEQERVSADIKNIYNAPNKKVAATGLNNFERKWGSKPPMP